MKFMASMLFAFGLAVITTQWLGISVSNDITTYLLINIPAIVAFNIILKVWR